MITLVSQLQDTACSNFQGRIKHTWGKSNVIMKGILSDFSYVLVNLQFLYQCNDPNEDHVLSPPVRQGAGKSATVWHLRASRLSLRMGFDACHKVTSRVEKSSTLQESPVEQSEKVGQGKQTNMVAMCWTSKHLVIRKVLHQGYADITYSFLTGI